MKYCKGNRRKRQNAINFIRQTTAGPPVGSHIKLNEQGGEFRGTRPPEPGQKNTTVTFEELNNSRRMGLLFIPFSLYFEMAKEENSLKVK